MKDEYLTPKEVAVLLKYTPAYVRKLVNKGVLVGYRPTGNRILIPSSQFNSMLESPEKAIFNLKTQKKDEPNK